MKLKTINERALSVATFLFFVIATISNVITTNESRDIILIIRGVAATLIIPAIALLMMNDKYSFRFLSSIITYILLVTYATYTSFLHGVKDYFNTGMALDIMVSTAGIYILSVNTARNSKPFPKKLQEYFLAYSIFMLALTITTNGFTFEFPPRFIFEYASDDIAQDINYSLGLTNFFGMAAVAAACCATERKNKTSYYPLFMTSILFLILCFLGGGRGEAFIAFFITLSIIILGGAWRLVSACVIIATIALLLIGDSQHIFDNIVIFQRFLEMLDGDLSTRDDLLKQAVNLLANDPYCFAIGCGFNYFQDFYGHAISLYPHNSITEAAITFGVPTVICMVVIVTVGSIRYIKSIGRVDFFMATYLYVFLISLKSGYLLGSWILITSSFTLGTFFYNTAKKPQNS